VHRAAFALPGYVAAAVDGLMDGIKSTVRSNASARNPATKKAGRR
jgi:hypothetical protein